LILTGPELVQQHRLGRIVIEPFSKKLVNPNSYNYRLGPSLKMVSHGFQDGKRRALFRKIVIPDEGVVLQPNQLYLGSTFERIGSSHYVTSLIGRSSVGRLGLYLQVSADLSQLGLVHRWTLELLAVQPIRVYAGMRLGQVSFWRTEGDKKMYSGRYRGTQTPTPSRIAPGRRARA
jgi:dCTP deaminase